MKSIKTLAIAVLISASFFTAEAREEEKPKKAAKPYPLKTCVVSDEKLGEMGDPYVFSHEGQELKLCCKPCLKTFKKDPKKYLKKVEAAEKQKKKS